MPGELFGPLTTTDALLAATGDRAWLQALLDAEAALAGAEADCGVIPADAARSIAGVCNADRYDAAELGRAARSGGSPVIPLVRVLADAVPKSDRRWVHWGATSQDILDTAAMLVSRRALTLIEADMDRLAGGCASLAEHHRDTLMVGRTLLQQALPTTFGAKAAGWLAGVLAARDQMRGAGQGLAVQLGGAVGTLASLGAAGPDVLAAYANRLGLSAPELPWHTARQRVAHLAGALAAAAGTTAKIAGDVALLMQSEVSEAAEPAAGGSSSMPHKRNPVGAALVNADARRAHGLLPVLYGALIAEHERAVGAWHAEWESLSELLATAGGAVARTADTIADLHVAEEAMAANLGASGGVLLAERVVMAATGAGADRSAATDAVTAAARRASQMGGRFIEELAAEPVVADHLDRPQLESLLDPAGYVGSAGIWIDRALAAYRKPPPEAVRDG